MASGKSEGKDPPTRDRKPGAGPGSVPFGQLLSEDLILIGKSFADKNEVMDVLVKKICAAKSLDEPAELLDKVRERERGISTTLESGLSLPHVRLKSFSGIAAALAVLPRPIIDPSQPEFPILAVLLFLSSDDSKEAAGHLQLLRSAAILFRVDFVKQLAASGSPAKALELIRRRESFS